MKAFAPATVANVSCGFDIFGFALEGPGDTVAARRRDAPGALLSQVTGDGGLLPRGSGENTAGIAAAALLRETSSPFGVEIRLEKGMPLASGLGSSAASAAASVTAVAALLDGPVLPGTLLACAAEGERAAAGFPHLDNVAPSLRGGFLLVRGSGREARIDPIPVPEDLFCAMLHPRVEIRTQEARAILPESIPIRDAVAQWGNTAALVAGLLKEDWDLIAGALEDRVAEPVRSLSVPGYDAVRKAAREEGALGCGLSGSGPALFALCRGRGIAEEVADTMKSALKRAGHDGAEAWVSRVGAAGARLLTEPMK